MLCNQGLSKTETCRCLLGPLWETSFSLQPRRNYKAFSGLRNTKPKQNSAHKERQPKVEQPRIPCRAAISASICSPEHTEPPEPHSPLCSQLRVWHYRALVHVTAVTGLTTDISWEAKDRTEGSSCLGWPFMPATQTKFLCASSKSLYQVPRTIFPWHPAKRQNDGFWGCGAIASMRFLD